MQHSIKVKTEYKNQIGKLTYYSPPIVPRKWKLTLVLALLGFLFFFQLNNWLSSISDQSADQKWKQTQIDLSLPHQQAPPSGEPPPLSEWKTFTIKSGTNLGYYFQQAGLEAKALPEVLATKDAHYLKKIFPGQKLRIIHQKGQLQTLQFDIDPLTTFVAQRQQNGQLTSAIEQKPIEKRVAFGGGQIFDSFFLAGKQAKLDDALIMELANVFAYDIDFAQDIKPNDNFKVLFEEHFVNGIKVGNGPIVAAEFVNNGKSFRAIRYTDSSGQSGYYNPTGQSLKKAFIRTPVQFTRISSHFNLSRRHPILHKIRAHRGVDYAAPSGTPVKAAGQGKVLFVGKKGGYGNTIILQHGARYSTLYAHLKGFAKNLRQGMHISQGQIIGYVGSTGLASGPHLHYEFQIDGVHHNPLTVPLPQAEAISVKAKPQFLAHVNQLLGLMDEHQKIMIATNE